MVKRLFDVVFSSLAIIALSPIFVFAIIGILVTSRGPIFYKAHRCGLNGKEFVMHKFRTMHVGADQSSKITSINDNRVFSFGSFLRLTKIDELPQLFDVVIGNMSIVGPRPEDATIVNNYYSEDDKYTLAVRPGLASPGSIFNYTHSHLYIDNENPELSYLENLLPVKLAIEKVYVRNQSLWYDILIIIRTLDVIVQGVFGVTKFEYPSEYKESFPDITN